MRLVQICLASGLDVALVERGVLHWLVQTVVIDGGEDGQHVVGDGLLGRLM